MALVVLLKGVNVGGHRRLRPSLLAREMHALEVVNVGATGAFVVWGPVAEAELRAEIVQRLPFEAEIMICPGSEVTDLLSHDFFTGRSIPRDTVRFVSVLPRAPRSGPALPMALPTPRRWLVKVLACHGRFVVGLHRRQMRVISELKKLERLYGGPATTRSWNTMKAIRAVLDGAVPPET